MNRWHRVALGGLLSTSIGVQPAYGQSLDCSTLTQGDSVRLALYDFTGSVIELGGVPQRFEGALVSLSPDSITMRTRGVAHAVHYRPYRVDFEKRSAVPHPRRRGFVQGFALGVGIGVPALTAMSFIACEDNPLTGGCPSSPFSFLRGAVVRSVAIGLLAGAVRAVFPARHGWTRFDTLLGVPRIR